MARPSKYTPEMLARAREYIEVYEKLDEVMPSIAGLSVYLKIARETIYAWSAEEGKGEFSDIVTELLSKQELKLSNGGLKGELNASITKLMLTKHGYSDKVESANYDMTPTVIEDDIKDGKVIINNQAPERAYAGNKLPPLEK